MRKLLCLLLIVFGAETYAASTPIKSKYDDRIQSQVYNALDVTKVYAKDGYSSVIVFAEDERISYKHTGFQDGWDITDNANFVLIKPLAVKQQSSEGESYFEPTPGQWNTNLFINTNKRTYSFDLILVPENSISSYQVNFSYPTEKEKQQVAQRQKDKRDREQQAIEKSLQSTKTPKNWDYVMKVKAGSETITPNYAYDDGIFTYLGFAPNKTFPAAFLLEGSTESLLNTNVKQDGNYQVLVIQKTAEKLVLRSGEKVVGIYNQSYGKTPVTYNTTISPNVARDER